MSRHVQLKEMPHVKRQAEEHQTQSHEIVWRMLEKSVSSFLTRSLRFAFHDK
jgi:hypothetical protein